ncbi:MAG: ABC transporter ATP-binding protein [Verrucomicrobiales bacterium]|nr:ABC transporter ATP-binding protein [Verrucomicrobiales bacterium]
MFSYDPLIVSLFVATDRTHYHLTSSQLWLRIWTRLRPYRSRLVLSTFLLILAVPFINFHPLVWGFVADHLVEKTLTPTLLAKWLVIMTATYLVGLALGAFQSYILEKAGQAFVRDIRVELFAKFQHQTLSYHHDHSSGELVTRMTSDVDAMEQSVLQGITSLVEEIVTFVVVAAMVLWLSPLVGAASIFPLAFAFIFIQKYNRQVKSVYEGVRMRLGNIGSFLQDRLAGIQVTQSFSREESEKEKFEEKAESFFESSVTASRLRNTYFPVVSTFGFLNNLVMLGVGAWLILKGSDWFTLGALIAYRGFWWRLQSPIRTIAQTSDILQRARAAASRVMELLDEPVRIESPAAPAKLPAIKGAVDFDRVTFSYTPEKTILKKVSFSVASGEFVAIAGGSGSGKSTILNLVPRFYDAINGRILVDGTDVKSLALLSLRSSIGYVGQENYLFSGTVDQNLRYGNPDASTEEIFEAAVAANAHDFIEHLAKGYQTEVGQNGVKLSGGQRQRLSLARAFLAQPQILLLDEPTASVEPESESLIHEAILKRTREGEGTTILVTHRVDLLQQAPRILFLENGELVGDGNHAELTGICTEYNDAYHRWEVEESDLPSRRISSA